MAKSQVQVEVRGEWLLVRKYGTPNGRTLVQQRSTVATKKTLPDALRVVLERNIKRTRPE